MPGHERSEIKGVTEGTVSARQPKVTVEFWLEIKMKAILKFLACVFAGTAALYLFVNND